MGKDYREYAARRKQSFSEDGNLAMWAFQSAYTVGGLLAQIREQRGLTQSDLSRVSGVQQADISRIERGNVEPKAATVQRLLDALNARVLIEILPEDGFAREPDAAQPEVHYVRLSDQA